MKLKYLKTFLLVFLMSGFCNLSFSQHIIRCATDEYMRERMLADPSIRQQRFIDEQQIQEYISRMDVSRMSEAVLTIPVVVHVVYRTTAQNISNAQIQSQIDVLNEDFARLNADTVNTPAPFKIYARATAFRFCLAQQDTAGNPSTGIERRQTTITSFSTNNNVKFYSSGGLNAWDPTRFLNIWVCSLGGGVLGYGEFPTSSVSNTYGLVVHYNVFGRVGTLSPTYNLGRTTVHEISHCFGLYHIWGDDNGTCGGTDYCPDTPNQGSENYGCRTFPYNDNCAPASSSPNGVMFMNYMDYSDDVCLNMFTFQQSVLMSSFMNNFYPTLLTSTACEAPTTGLDDFAVTLLPSVYPNPSSGVFNLDFFLTPSYHDEVTVTVTDLSG
ncbi:MAG: M43 family zinc metalloprotease, partial [Bacteroidota bacterium]